MAPSSTPPGISIHGTRGSGAGRSIRADRSFMPGELIASFSEPVLVLPDGPSSKTVCNHCLTNGIKPRACTGCKAIVYCSPTCQKANWALIHKQECKAFRKVRDSVNKDWLPTPVRALVQILSRYGDKDLKAAIDGLEDNVEAFKDREDVWKDIELQAVAGVTYASKPETEEELSLARQILCKIQTNAFDRSDVDISQTGIFLDPTLAMVNHSCLPNAVVSFINRKALLRAEAPIQEGDEVTISYIDNTKPKTFRQLGLDLYHFRCECLRCSEDLDVYEVCKKSPVIELNSLSLVPDLKPFRKPPISVSTQKLLEIKSQIDEMYIACEAGFGRNAGDSLEVLRHQWSHCQPLVKARMWATEPLAQTLEGIIRYYVGQGNLVHALSVSCFVRLNCDPFKYVAPFKQWRLKGIMVIAKMLTNTAPYPVMAELAKKTDPALFAALQGADQVTICQSLLLMVVKYGPLAHSEDWEILALAKGILHDIESLEGRDSETALLHAWMESQGGPEGAFFEKEVLNKIEHLASFAIGIIEKDLEQGASLVRR